MTMVVHVSFPPMLPFHVPVRDVDVLDLGMVVVVGMSGQQMGPVLAPMQVVRDVEMLVTVFDGVVVVPLRLDRHVSHPFPWSADAEARPDTPHSRAPGPPVPTATNRR